MYERFGNFTYTSEKRELKRIVKAGNGERMGKSCCIYLETDEEDGAMRYAEIVG